MMLETGLNVRQINEYVRYFLDRPDRTRYQDTEREALLGETGPFWYRGYHEHNHEYVHLPEEDFEEVLDYFDAKYIFIGHTNVKEVTSLYHDRVFAIDVPFYSHGFSMYGLLLKGDRVFQLNTAAERTQIR
jgi:hypothetical protein